MVFFILFLIIPLIEITLFIHIGGAIGVGTTMLLVVLTAVIGAGLIKHQGFQALRSMQSALRESQMPIQEIFDGICLLVSGAFLMTPGFFTDTLGFLLLIPPLRAALLKQAIKSGKFSIFGSSMGAPKMQNRYTQFSDQSGNDLEGDYERIEDEDPKNKP